jgi:ATP-dependent helicase/nuclease subunit A
VAKLLDLLRLADFEPPQALLHWLLVGPWDGRRKLVARLGREANDPIDELLNAALAYAAAHTPSLQGFVQWFDAGEGELKREAGAAGNLLRVMTVHGSKGLQAPIVILADAAGNPDSSPTRGLALDEVLPGGPGRTLPVPDLAKEHKVGRIAEAEAVAALAERQEHWRLLYVAMTRAEEALFIGGALGKREAEPAADSWYARLVPLFADDPLPDAIWGERREWGSHAEMPGEAVPAAQKPAQVLPVWTTRPIGPEPRPPRPLAPSAAGEEQGADPPLPPGVLAVAARRGVLIHRLLERLPDIAPALREEQAAVWLARNATDLAGSEHAEILERVLAVLAAPDWAELFSPAALAEVPLAATVGGQVIAGTADRLLIVRVGLFVGFLTPGGRPRAGLAVGRRGTFWLLGAFAAALGAIYPGRRVEAALLYTQTPLLIALPPELLEAHKPGLVASQESLGG